MTAHQRRIGVRPFRNEDVRTFRLAAATIDGTMMHRARVVRARFHLERHSLTSVWEMLNRHTYADVA